MTFENALKNIYKAKCIPYRKDTLSKINELIIILYQLQNKELVSRTDIIKYLSSSDNNGDRIIYASDLDLLEPIEISEHYGCWIYKKKSLVSYYECSECKKYILTVAKNDKFEDLNRTDSYKFCPRCGIKMRYTEHEYHS